MINRIVYDDIIRTRKEWEKYLIDFSDGGNKPIGSSSISLDTQYYDALNSWYFLIITDKTMRDIIKSKIRMQAFSKAGNIAEESVLREGCNCELYRISTPIKLDINYKDKRQIYNGDWIKNKTIHDKQARAITNLISKIEEEAFS